MVYSSETLSPSAGGSKISARRIGRMYHYMDKSNRIDVPLMSLHAEWTKYPRPRCCFSMREPETARHSIAMGVGWTTQLCNVLLRALRIGALVAVQGRGYLFLWSLVWLSSMGSVFAPRQQHLGN